MGGKRYAVSVWAGEKAGDPRPVRLWDVLARWLARLAGRVLSRGAGGEAAGAGDGGLSPGEPAGEEKREPEGGTPAVTSFAVHFPLEQFTRKANRAPTAAELAAAGELSHILETARRLLGDEELVITSWLRAGELGQHGDGTGVDFRPPRRLSQREIFDRLSGLRRALGRDFGELIFYPFSDWHVHVTLATRGDRNQVLIASADEQTYSVPSPELVARIPDVALPVPPATAAVLLAVALGAGALAAAAIFGKGAA